MPTEKVLVMAGPKAGETSLPTDAQTLLDAIKNATSVTAFGAAVSAAQAKMAVFFGANALTAITDNAALTYLGSLVQGLSEEFKYALVAGAVTGGGLTIIANAPNPAGIAILRRHFPNETVQPGYLLLGALLPTVIAAVAFLCLA